MLPVWVLLSLLHRADLPQPLQSELLDSKTCCICLQCSLATTGDAPGLTVRLQSMLGSRTTLTSAHARHDASGCIMQSPSCTQM